MTLAERRATDAPPEESFVHEGQDGWLFLTAGSNNVVGQFQRSAYMCNALKGWRRLVVARERRCRRLGIGYRHLIVPEKLTVYDHKLDGLQVAIRLSPAVRLRRGLLLAPRARRVCIDTVGLFRRERDGEPLFYRTDSHWSFAGCRLAYGAVCAAVGACPREDLAERPSYAYVHTGDLGEKLDPPRSEDARRHVVLRDAQRVHASPIVRSREAAGLAPTLHIGSHVVFRNEAVVADPRRVLVFGDSYAHFGPTMLTAMLAETFREVHFIWSSSIDWGYVERTKPDLMLTEIAERFMFRLPDDAFDTQAYVEERYGAEIRSAV